MEVYYVFKDQALGYINKILFSQLTTSRRKIGLNHWGTDISLSWGERTFTYHDEVNFLSFSEWFLRVEADSPNLHINRVMAKVETVAEKSGEQAIQMIFQKQNVTVHSAK